MGIPDFTVFRGINDLTPFSGKWDSSSPWHAVAKWLFKHHLESSAYRIQGFEQPNNLLHRAF